VHSKSGVQVEEESREVELLREENRRLKRTFIEKLN
jgi:hypothetical protein